MRFARSDGGQMGGSILVEAVAMAGHLSALTGNAYDVRTNYQNCFEIGLSAQRPLGEPSPTRLRISLPPRDKLGQNLCLGRESEIGPYMVRSGNAESFESLPGAPVDPIPVMSEAEQYSRAIYDYGLAEYMKESTTDVEAWDKMVKDQEKCRAIYTPRVEALQSRQFARKRDKSDCLERLQNSTQPLDRMKEDYDQIAKDLETGIDVLTKDITNRGNRVNLANKTLTECEGDLAKATAEADQIWENCRNTTQLLVDENKIVGNRRSECYERLTDLKKEAGLRPKHPRGPKDWDNYGPERTKEALGLCRMALDISKAKYQECRSVINTMTENKPVPSNFPPPK